jgi:hypothetical protein
MKLLNVVLFFAASVAAIAGVDVGQPAPDFTLSDLDGQKHSLADYRGKTVVLEWNNPDCPFVKKHYESDNLPKLQREAAKDGVVWLVINSGAPGTEGAGYTAAQFKDWMAKHRSTPTAYLRDPDGTVGHAYNARTTPHMYVIDAKGVLVYQGGIDSIRSASKADIAKATNYVSEALSAVKAGQPVPTSTSAPYGCSVKYGSKS